MGTIKIMTTDQTAIELAQAPEPSVAQLMQSVIAQGITESSVAVMERLVALKERLDDKSAEREFAAAFADLQAELPRFAARGKADRYNYMKYEDIMAELSPLLVKHGFSVTFSSQVDAVRITQLCTVTHRNGHSRTNQYAVRMSNRTPGLNECQQDGLAGTYAKRYAVCGAFNITCETDSDGAPDVSMDGELIGHDRVQYLTELLAEKGADVAKFLALAGADKIENIRTGSYDVLVRALLAKKKA